MTIKQAKEKYGFWIGSLWTIILTITTVAFAFGQTTQAKNTDLENCKTELTAVKAELKSIQAIDTRLAKIETKVEQGDKDNREAHRMIIDILKGKTVSLTAAKP